MNIRVDRSRQCCFGNLKYGEVFEYDNSYYMKMYNEAIIGLIYPKNPVSSAAAVNLKTGGMYLFADTQAVMLVEAELVIK